MRYLFVMAMAFVCMMLQMPLLSLLGLRDFSLDAPLVATVFLAATSPGTTGLVVVSAMGLLTDLFMPGGVPGMQMEILAIVFLLSRRVVSRLQLNRTIPLMIVVLAGGVVSLLLFMLFSVIFDRSYVYSTSVLTAGTVQIFITAIFSPLLFRLFGVADGRGHRRRDSRSLFV